MLRSRWILTLVDYHFWWYTVGSSGRAFLLLSTVNVFVLPLVVARLFCKSPAGGIASSLGGQEERVAAAAVVVMVVPPGKDREDGVRNFSAPLLNKSL